MDESRSMTHSIGDPGADPGRRAKNGPAGKMRMKRAFSIIMLILVFGGALGAGSMKSGGGEVELVGRVYVMGNEPLTQVALKSDDGRVYVLLGKYDRELRALQGRRVSVSGIPSEEKPRGAEAVEVKSFKVLEP